MKVSYVAHKAANKLQDLDSVDAMSEDGGGALVKFIREGRGPRGEKTFFQDRVFR
jgi:hypothetical protein